MRRLIALLLAVTALALPAAAQNNPDKSKSAPDATARTYLDTIDFSSGEAVVRGFVEAYAANDFLKAYYLLSPQAKSGFVNKLFEFNDALLFPGIAGGRAVTDPDDPNSLPAEDMMQDVYLDGAAMFDNAMQTAHALGLAPFDFDSGALVSATFEHEAEARYLVGARDNTGPLVITAIKLSNGDWRVQRLVWPRSDPDATPWGFK